MLARPAAIALMRLSDRFGSLGAASWIVACGGMRNEMRARRADLSR
jgi:hypothetical protein